MENGQYQLLIVDDSRTFIQIVKDMIVRNIDDVNVWDANSGMEALRILGNHNIDIILLDIFMPGYDGFEMARVIRANEKTSKIPIIFVTGSDPNKDLQNKALLLGGIDYLHKPFTEFELVKLINLYFRFIKWEREINAKLDNKNNELKNEITERKKVEKSLLELTAKLKEANLTKDKFFSIIAHDLRSPLGAFKNATKMLADTIDEFDQDDLLEFIQSMRDSSEKLYALLENLLQWSKLQQGGITYNPEEITLRNIVQDNLGLLKANAEAKKIKLTNNIPLELVVIADPYMLTTVLRNLISNAVKFTSIGGSIWLDFKVSGDNIEVSVNDNGVGISSKDIPKLFKLAENYSSVGTNMETGTGLGLILCRDFINKHKGEIWAESTEGKGSSFKFTLKSARTLPEIIL